MFGNCPEYLAARRTSAKGGERLWTGDEDGDERRADLSPYPTGVAARLSAHCTFSLGRPGLLGDFSVDGSRGRRYVAADGRVVRHWGLARE